MEEMYRASDIQTKENIHSEKKWSLIAAQQAFSRKIRPHLKIRTTWCLNVSSVIWVIFEIISGNIPVSQYVTDIDANFLPHNFLAQILKEAKQLLRLALS